MFKRPFFKKNDVNRGKVKSIDDSLTPVNQTPYIDSNSETNYKKKNQILKYSGIGLAGIASIAVMWNIALNNIKKDYSDIKESVPVVLQIDSVQSYDGNLIYNNNSTDPEDDPLENKIKKETNNIKKPLKIDKKVPFKKESADTKEYSPPDTLDETISTDISNKIYIGYGNRNVSDEKVVRIPFGSYEPSNDIILLIDDVVDIITNGARLGSSFNMAYLDLFDGIDTSKIIKDGHTIKLNLNKEKSNIFELYPVTKIGGAIEIPDPSTVTIDGESTNVKFVDGNSFGQMIVELDKEYEGGVMTYRTVVSSELPKLSNNEILTSLRDGFDFTDVPDIAKQSYKKAIDFAEQGDFKKAHNTLIEYIRNAGYDHNSIEVKELFNKWIDAPGKLSFEEFVAVVYNYNCNIANNQGAILDRSLGIPTVQLAGYAGTNGVISTSSGHSIFAALFDEWRSADATPFKKSTLGEQAGVITSYVKRSGDNWKFTEQETKQRYKPKSIDNITEESIIDSEFEDLPPTYSFSDNGGKRAGKQDLEVLEAKIEEQDRERSSRFTRPSLTIGQRRNFYMFDRYITDGDVNNFSVPLYRESSSGTLNSVESFISLKTTKTHRIMQSDFEIIYSVENFNKEKMNEAGHKSYDLIYGNPLSEEQMENFVARFTYGISEKWSKLYKNLFMNIEIPLIQATTGNLLGSGKRASVKVMPYLVFEAENYIQDNAKVSITTTIPITGLFGVIDDYRHTVDVAPNPEIVYGKSGYVSHTRFNDLGFKIQAKLEIDF